MELEVSNKQSIEKRNYIFFIFEGAFFFIGCGFIAQDGLVSLFIDHYTGSLQLVGIAATIKLLSGTLAKMLVGPYISRVKNMPKFTSIVMLTTRPLMLFMMPVLMFTSSSGLIVGAFMVFYSILWFGQGVTGVAWSDIFARTIAPANRGKIHGNQQLIGGIAGLGVGLVVKLLLDSTSLSRGASFGAIFGLGGLAMLVSGIILTKVRDFPREANRAPINLIAYFKTLPKYLSEQPNFRKMTEVMVIAKVGILVSPFIVLVAKNVHGISGPSLTNLIYLQVVGGLIGGFMWGRISHKYGNRAVIVTSNAMLIIGNLLVCLSILMATTTIAAILVAAGMIISGINAGSWLGFINYMLDIAGEGERIDMMVLHSLIILPTSFLGYFLGLLADRQGYFAVFALAVAAMAIAFSQSLKIIKLR